MLTEPRPDRLVRRARILFLNRLNQNFIGGNTLNSRAKSKDKKKYAGGYILAVDTLMCKPAEHRKNLGRSTGKNPTIRWARPTPDGAEQAFQNLEP